MRRCVCKHQDEGQYLSRDGNYNDLDAQISLSCTHAVHCLVLDVDVKEGETP